MEVTLKNDLFNVRRFKREEESNQKLVEEKFRPDSKETSPRASPTTTTTPATTATSSSPTTAATSNNQKLRFSIAHIMGFMSGGGGQSSDVEVKEEDEEDEKTEDVVNRSNVGTQLPKLWRPQPNRDYIDFGAMALLSRQYSLFNQVLSFFNNHPSEVLGKT